MADISIYGQLKEIFEGIRDERRMASNTATRIGNAFLALLEYAKSVDKPISGDADTAAKLQTARSIWGQMFDGTADVTGNMTGVGSITPTGTDLKIVGNLLVTGGITMYATDGVSSGIMDAILVDNDTIGINDKGQLYVIKAGGGGTVTAISVNGSRYNPSDGVITLPDYPTSLAWDKINGKPGSLSGYGIKDAYTKKEVDDLLKALIISNADSATKLQTARNIWGQSFDGTADVSGNMTGVGSITPTGTDLKIVGNLLVTGGITMYATDGVSSGIMDAILVDNDTIGINDKGQLYVIKAGGGGTVTAISVNGSRYNPSDGVITLPDYPTSLAWDKITGKPSTFTPSSHSHTFASLSDKPSTLAGYGITNAYTKTETDNILKAFNAASATKLQTARNIWGQSFDGTADVSGNMTGVGSITPTGTDLKIVGNLLVTGGITMYATDGVSSALMDAILVDGKTIGKDPSTGALYAINTGNVKGIIVNGNTYNSVDAAGLITLPNYPTELSWSAITGKPTSFTPSSHTHNYTSTVKLGTVEYKVANNVVSLPAYPTIPNLAKGTTTGTGNVVTDLTVSAHTITLTKGITALTSHQTIYALTLQRGGADVGTYTPNSKAATLNVALPTFAEILSKPTTLGGFGITDAYTKTEADNRYVNVAGDTMTGALSFNNAYPILWGGGGWWQRLVVTDDSTADTAVFTFQQTSNSGGSYTDLMTIKDNGKVIANTFVGALSGNATSATKLQTVRKINGTDFDGTAPITTSLWGTARNIGIVNSDGTGTAVTTSVNGSGNVNLKLPATIKAALTGNASSASKLQNSRTLWGQSFDGTANVSGNMTNVGTITPTGTDLKIVGNLLVTGGITMYATDGVSSALMDAILVDGKTIGKDPSTGALYAINTGNVKGIIVNGNTYNSVDAAGLITLPNYPTELSWSAITGKPTSFTPSSHTHNYTSTVKLGTVEYKVANNVVSLPAYPTIPNLAKGTTTGTGNVVTDLTVSAHTITLTKGITALTSHQTIYALTLQRGGADVGTYTPNSKAATLNVALPTFAEILSKPTTLGGFGITDAYTKTEADNRYVNVAGDTMTGALSFNNAYPILWGGGGWWQRLVVTDDSTADTAVFTFQQTSNSGGSYTDLMTIKDNGKVIANTFVGALSGNATSATKLQTARKINGTDFDGTADITTAKWGAARTLTLTGSVTGSISMDGSGNVTLATTTNHTHSYLPLSGGTMTGVITAKAYMYEDAYNGALNMANSDIYALNSIYTSDLSDSQAEGIHFYRTSTTVDTFRIANGVMYFAPNRALGGTATEYTIIHTGNIGSQSVKYASSAGNAATSSYLTYINSSDLASSTSTWRRVWFCCDDNTTGRPAYSDNFCYQSSTNTLKVGTLSGNATTATALTSSAGSSSTPVYFSGGKPVACGYAFTSYLPLAGGTMTANSRISHADGNMYLGRADNNGWVMCQDICSHTASGDSYWSLRTNGTLHAKTTYIGGHLWLNAQAVSSSTAGASQLIFGNAGTQHVVISSSTGAIVINPSTSSSTGQLVLRVGTSATSDFAGNILAGGAITMYSDLRKKNVLSDEVLSVKEIAQAPLFLHTYKSDQNQNWHIGTSAQYWAARHNNWFTRLDNEGYYQMELQNLGVAMGISLAREIVRYESKTDKKIRLMRNRIKELEAKVAELERRVA